MKKTGWRRQIRLRDGRNEEEEGKELISSWVLHLCSNFESKMPNSIALSPYSSRSRSLTSKRSGTKEEREKGKLVNSILSTLHGGSSLMRSKKERTWNNNTEKWTLEPFYERRLEERKEEGDAEGNRERENRKRQLTRCVHISQDTHRKIVGPFLSILETLLASLHLFLLNLAIFPKTFLWGLPLSSWNEKETTCLRNFWANGVFCVVTALSKSPRTTFFSCKN